VLEIVLLAVPRKFMTLSCVVRRVRVQFVCYAWLQASASV